ncbi:MAG: hypothetical protein AAGA55_01010 [Planctomycetota bacterium]
MTTDPGPDKPTGGPPPDHEIPISRAVGRFFGHLWKGIRTPADAGEAAPATRTERVRETRESRPAEVEGQPVILRRTTIEEIEFPAPDRPAES